MAYAACRPVSRPRALTFPREFPAACWMCVNHGSSVCALSIFWTCVALYRLLITATSEFCKNPQPHHETSESLNAETRNRRNSNRSMRATIMLHGNDGASQFSHLTPHGRAHGASAERKARGGGPQSAQGRSGAAKCANSRTLSDRRHAAPLRPPLPPPLPSAPARLCQSPDSAPVNSKPYAPTSGCLVAS